MTHSSEAEKKAWEHPQLIVLARNNPEEAVLGFCKSVTVGSSMNSNANLCSQVVAPGSCDRCSPATWS